jgi:hypothetical protein
MFERPKTVLALDRAAIETGSLRNFGFKILPDRLEVTHVDKE